MRKRTAAQAVARLDRDSGLISARLFCFDSNVLAKDKGDSLSTVGTAAARQNGAVAFATTHWSLVLTAQGESPAAREAHEKLCRTYWRRAAANMCGKVFRALRVPLAIRLAQSAQGSSASWQMRQLRFVWQLLSQPCSVNPRYPWQARWNQSKKAVPKSSLNLDPNERRLGQPSVYAWRRNLEIDICKIAVIVHGDERRHAFRPSKAACLRVGARVVAIVSDRFSTGR